MKWLHSCRGKIQSHSTSTSLVCAPVGVHLAHGLLKVCVTLGDKYCTIDEFILNDIHLDILFIDAPSAGWGPGAQLNQSIGGTPCWIPSNGGQIPPGAVQGGQDGEPVYVARARHEGIIATPKTTIFSTNAHVSCYFHSISGVQALCCQANWYNRTVWPTCHTLVVNIHTPTTKYCAAAIHNGCQLLATPFHPMPCQPASQRKVNRYSLAVCTMRDPLQPAKFK